MEYAIVHASDDYAVSAEPVALDPSGASCWRVAMRRRECGSLLALRGAVTVAFVVFALIASDRRTHAFHRDLRNVQPQDTGASRDRLDVF
jgi:hypothetical protein